MYVYNMLGNINANFSDINKFINIYNKVKNINDNEILFDFRNTGWLSGEMVALFAAICFKLEKDHKIFISCSNNVTEIMQGNNFSKIVNNMESGKTKDTAILFRDFSNELNEKKLDCFDLYIKDELNQKLLLSKSEVDYIIAYLSEIFINARTHGKTNNIFCCGQKYPKMNKVKIMLVDAGVGIPYNVRNGIAMGLSDVECIIWSLKKGNSTKVDAGGLGLADICEFIRNHNGNISIFSLNGQYDYREEIEINSDNKFEGTIISLEFDYSMISNADKLLLTKRKKDFDIKF